MIDYVRYRPVLSTRVWNWKTILSFWERQFPGSRLDGGDVHSHLSVCEDETQAPPSALYMPENGARKWNQFVSLVHVGTWWYVSFWMGWSGTDKKGDKMWQGNGRVHMKQCLVNTHVKAIHSLSILFFVGNACFLPSLNLNGFGIWRVENGAAWSCRESGHCSYMLKIVEVLDEPIPYMP